MKILNQYDNKTQGLSSWAGAAGKNIYSDNDFVGEKFKNQMMSVSLQVLIMKDKKTFEYIIGDFNDGERRKNEWKKDG